MKAAYVNPFLKSFLDVMQTMGQIEMSHGKPTKKEDAVALGDLSGIIGMVGAQTRGSLAITLEKRLAFEIYANMVGERHDKLDEEIADMVGEITNMVCGGAKRDLSGEGYEFDLATPSVISGENHSIHHKVEGMKLLMPFDTDFGKAYIEICFDN